MSSKLAYPVPTDSVKIDLFNEGEFYADGKPKPMRELRYSIKSIKRIKRIVGGSIMGAGGALMTIDEELLPVMLHEGLRHEATVIGAVCGCGFHAENGIDPDVTVDQIESLPSSAYSYLLQKFSEAYLASQPKKKLATLIQSPETPTPAAT